MWVLHTSLSTHTMHAFLSVRVRPQIQVVKSLSSQDECYQVRQIFAQKLHMALVKLLLPLEYMAVFALCAKDPVKERRAHARQCLLKNISVRREYIKQNPMAQGKDTCMHIYTGNLIYTVAFTYYHSSNSLAWVHKSWSIVSLWKDKKNYTISVSFYYLLLGMDV